MSAEYTEALRQEIKKSGKTDEQAFADFKAAADNGDVDALSKLGLMHQDGLGTPQNDTLMFECFLKAAEKEHGIAQYLVSLCYFYARGTPKNHNEAFKWTEKAAKQGIAGALISLGTFYCFGAGTEKNIPLSIKWYRQYFSQASEKEIAKVIAKNDGNPTLYYCLALSKKDKNFTDALIKKDPNDFFTRLMEDDALSAQERTAWINRLLDDHRKSWMGTLNKNNRIAAEKALAQLNSELQASESPRPSAPPSDPHILYERGDFATLIERYPLDFYDFLMDDKNMHSLLREHWLIELSNALLQRKDASEFVSLLSTIAANASDVMLNKLVFYPENVYAQLQLALRKNDLALLSKEDPILILKAIAIDKTLSEEKRFELMQLVVEPFGDETNPHNFDVLFHYAYLLSKTPTNHAKDGVEILADLAKIDPRTFKALMAQETKEISPPHTPQPSAPASPPIASMTLNELREAATLENNPEAQFKLAEMYLRGESGLKQSNELAAKWYWHAIKNGHEEAETELTKIAQKDPDKFLEQMNADKSLDPKTREHWVQIIAEEYYQRGINNEWVHIQLKWYTRAAALGHAPSQFELGSLHRTGTGVLDDNKEAAEWFRKAATQKNKGALKALQSLAESTKDPTVQYHCAMAQGEEAIKALHQKDPKGFESQLRQDLLLDKKTFQHWLKIVKAPLQAVPVEVANEPAKAAQPQTINIEDFVVVEKPAEPEKDLVQQYLKLSLEEQHTAEAVQLLQRAVEMDNADAHYHLGKCYQMGWGVPRDPVEGIRLIELAAENGNADAQVIQGYKYYYGGDGIKKDRQKAAEWFLKAANQKDPEAHRNLGGMYLHGDGVAKDASKSAEHYKQVELQARAGIAKAQNSYGRMLQYGRGAEKNPEEAVAYYQKAALQNDAAAQNNLGACYRRGIGVEKNEGKAFELYQKSAAQGNADSLALLGFCYERGVGVTKDEVKAVQLCRLAAEQQAENSLKNLEIIAQKSKDPIVHYHLAMAKGDEAIGELLTKDPRSFASLLMKDELLDEATRRRWIEKLPDQVIRQLNLEKKAEAQKPAKDKEELETSRPLPPEASPLASTSKKNAAKDLVAKYLKLSLEEQHTAEAVQLLVRAVEMNDADAHYYLGKCYKMGWGVQRNPAKGIQLIERAAELGNADAQVIQGEKYYYGYGGVKKDSQKAAEWLLKAAGKKHPAALKKLGFMYARGQSVAQDANKSAEYYKQVELQAREGNAEAQFCYGAMLRDGLGVEKNQKEAVEWTQKAALQNHAGAQSQLGYCYLSGKDIEKNEVKAIEIDQLSAAQGNVHGLNNLGACYANGDGVEKNELKAAELLRLAAEQQEGSGALENLETLVKNSKNPMVHYHLAMTKGDKAIEVLRKKDPDKFLEKINEDKLVDPKTREHWIQVVAEEYFQRGEKTWRNTKAEPWYKKAADLGHAGAQNMLGAICLQNKNYDSAVEWFTKAADKNEPRGLYNLGSAYYFGHGVKRNLAKSIELFKKASEGGHVGAKHNLEKILREHPELNIPAPSKSPTVERKVDSPVETKAEKPAPASYPSVLKPGESAETHVKNIEEERQKINEQEKAKRKQEGERLYDLSTNYQLGRGVEKDLTKALEFMQQAAALHFEAALTELPMLERMKEKEEKAKMKKAVSTTTKHTTIFAKAPAPHAETAKRLETKLKERREARAQKTKEAAQPPKSPGVRKKPGAVAE